jgi:3-oxo-5-alpha-steroid 4-dehydrogenase 1
VDLITSVWLAAAIGAYFALRVMPAPYGRHTQAGWGPRVSARLGWTVMELPALLVVIACFALDERRASATAWVFFTLWCLHYGRRIFFYALRLSRDSAPMPVLMSLSGALFNVVNGWLQGRGLLARGDEWRRDPRFALGALLFLAGMAVNWHADRTLQRLRAQGTGYVIPRGGLFDRVACPNYLGEIVEWCGWAVMTWSPAGASFAVWTAANLAPRARSHLRWYRDRFPDYPTRRRALIPF